MDTDPLQMSGTENDTASGQILCQNYVTVRHTTVTSVSNETRRHNVPIMYPDESADFARCVMANGELLLCKQLSRFAQEPTVHASCQSFAGSILQIIQFFLSTHMGTGTKQ